MSEPKSLQGLIVSNNGVAIKQILFDEKKGLILEEGNLGIPESKIDYLFGDDCLVFPGMGDVHIHAREDVTGQHNYKEDYLSASEAAICGGVTFAADMPNNPVPPISDSSYQAKMQLVKKGLIPFFLYAGIGPETKPLSYSVPYKAYMGPSIGELFFKSNQQLEESIKNYKKQSVSFHCEDPEILEQNKSEKSHLLRRPIKAEILATEVALNLIEKYELKGKLCHYSASEGLPKIRAAKEKGINVQAEVTPQHLYFNSKMISPSKEVYFQMNPPIRGKNDQEEMLHAFLKGEIDFLATDHAPHSLEEKERGISGLPGLDIYGPFCAWLLNNHKMDPRILCRVASENPGKFVNHFLPSLSRMDPYYERFGKGFGIIEKGFCANFTVLNTKASQEITQKSLRGKSQHSPFVGETLPGKIEAVFVFGKKINK